MGGQFVRSTWQTCERLKEGGGQKTTSFEKKLLFPPNLLERVGGVRLSPFSLKGSERIY